jgi:hypothetical protein
MLGCPSEENMPRSFTPSTFDMAPTTPFAFASFTRRSGPTTLTLFSPLMPDSASSTLSEIKQQNQNGFAERRTDDLFDLHDAASGTNGVRMDASLERTTTV